MKFPRIAQVALAAVIATSGVAVASPAEAASKPGVMVSWNLSSGAGPVKVKPKTISSWETWSLTSLRWTRLTRTTGKAKGVLHKPVQCSSCEPSFSATRVTVTFSKVKKQGGKLAFTKLVARDSRGRTTTFHLPRDLKY